jgi:hypothetical protein
MLPLKHGKDLLLKYERLLITLILLLAFGLRVWGLDDRNIWWDEGLVAWAARLPAAAIVDWTARDVHPPLYFLLQRLWWFAVGDGEFVMRYTSVLVGTLGVAWIYLLGRTMGGPLAGLLAALFLAVSTFAVSWSQEMRMYIGASAAATAALWAALRYWQTGQWRHWGLYVLAAAAGLWLLYLSVSVLIIANLAFLWVWIGRRLPLRAVLRWAAAQVLVLLLYLPWLAYALPRMPSWSTAEPFTIVVLRAALRHHPGHRRLGQPGALPAAGAAGGGPAGRGDAIGLAAGQLHRAARRAGDAAAGAVTTRPAGLHRLAAHPHLLRAAAGPALPDPAGGRFLHAAGLGPGRPGPAQPLAGRAGHAVGGGRGQRWACWISTPTASAATTCSPWLPPSTPSASPAMPCCSTATATGRSSPPSTPATGRGCPTARRWQADSAGWLLEPLWQAGDGLWLATTPDAVRMDPQGHVRRWLEARAAAVTAWDYGENALAFYAKTPQRAAQVAACAPASSCRTRRRDLRRGPAGRGLPPVDPLSCRRHGASGAVLARAAGRRSTGDAARSGHTPDGGPGRGAARQPQPPAGRSAPDARPAGRPLHGAGAGRRRRPSQAGRFTLVHTRPAGQAALASATPLDLRLGASIRLLGYELAQDSVQPGGDCGFDPLLAGRRSR